jgi:putative hydrolase of HD superfamily
MAMMLMCLKDEMWLDFDMLKAMKMIMIHDLWEIYVGDSFIAFDKEAKKLKDQRENESLEKVLSLLPDDLKNEFTLLANEYNQHETIESKIVRALDQLQYKIQYLASWWLYKWKDIDLFNRSAEKDYEYGKPRVEFNEYLHDMFKKLVAESRQYD